jgi:transcriptional regulator with XRE-family HTH domain
MYRHTTNIGAIFVFLLVYTASGSRYFQAGVPLNYAKAFGRRLRSVREAAGLTQERVAERAHTDAKYVSALENGRSSPTLDTIMALAKALNVRADDLLLLEGEDADNRTLRKRIETSLDGCNEEQLRRIYRLIRDVVEP